MKQIFRTFTPKFKKKKNLHTDNNRENEEGGGTWMGGGDMHRVKRRSELAVSAAWDADNEHKAPNDGNRLNWQI